MKPALLLLALFLTGFGTSQPTVHEVCSDIVNKKRYKDYDECYAEVTKDRDRKAAMRRAIMSAPDDNSSTDCVTTVRNGRSYTNCKSH